MQCIANIMHEFIQITRHRYEEPYAINLVILASNGMTSGGLELHINPDRILELGQGLIDFPGNQTSRYLFQYGSEYPEDRFACYFRLHAYALNSLESYLLSLVN